MRTCAIAIAVLVASQASAKPREHRDLGIVLLAGGIVLAAAGAPVLAQGIVTSGTANCAAFPMTPGVCNNEARNLKIAGSVLLGVGVSFSVSGGVLFGVARDNK